MLPASNCAVQDAHPAVLHPPHLSLHGASVLIELTCNLCPAVMLSVLGPHMLPSVLTIIPMSSSPQVIWLSCLPLGLWPVVGWGTVPLTVAIAFLLLGIEEIGVAVEEVS